MNNKDKNSQKGETCWRKKLTDRQYRLLFWFGVVLILWGCLCGATAFLLSPTTRLELFFGLVCLSLFIIALLLVIQMVRCIRYIKDKNK